MCSCGMKNDGKACCYYSPARIVAGIKRKNEMLRQLDEKLDAIEAVVSVSCERPEDSEAFVCRLYYENARRFCRVAKRIVTVVESFKKSYPEFARAIENYVVTAKFPIYTKFYRLNVALVKTGAYSDAYTYMKHLAKGADRVFEVGTSCGFGVGGSLGHVDFMDTAFFCNEESGVSGMFVSKEGIKERVIVKNNEEKFDYEKAAMALLLKGVFGGGGKAVDMVRFVENELRAANAVTRDTDKKREQSAEPHTEPESDDKFDSDNSEYADEQGDLGNVLFD